MSFVVETLTTPSAQAEFRALNLVSPITRKLAKPELIGTWTVDRQRELYFVNLGGGAAEMPYFLVLTDKNGPLLHAHAREKSVKDQSSGTYVIVWTLEFIQIPTEHASRTDELVAALRDALVVDAGRLPGTVTEVRVEMAASRGI